MASANFRQKNILPDPPCHQEMCFKARNLCTQYLTGPFEALQAWFFAQQIVPYTAWYHNSMKGLKRDPFKQTVKTNGVIQMPHNNPFLPLRLQRRRRG